MKRDNLVHYGFGDCEKEHQTYLRNIFLNARSHGLDHSLSRDYHKEWLDELKLTNEELKEMYEEWFIVNRYIDYHDHFNHFILDKSRTENGKYVKIYESPSRKQIIETIIDLRHFIVDGGKLVNYKFPKPVNKVNRKMVFIPLKHYNEYAVVGSLRGLNNFFKMIVEKESFVVHLSDPKDNSDKINELNAILEIATDEYIRRQVKQQIKHLKQEVGVIKQEKEYRKIYDKLNDGQQLSYNEIYDYLHYFCDETVIEDIEVYE